MPDEARIVDDAYAFLRSRTTGELRYGERVAKLSYVIAPDGRLVAPVSAATLDEADTVLFVPEYGEGAMELQVTLLPLDPDGPEGALADRWRIHHGDPPESFWAAMAIDAARYRGWVVDGDGLMRANPLAPEEARLCRRINEEYGGDLPRICRHVTGADAERPLVVAIDPLGIDVRRRFDVIRLAAPRPMINPEDVTKTIAQLAAASSSADR